jgi:hypothetical protein
MEQIEVASHPGERASRKAVPPVRIRDVTLTLASAHSRRLAKGRIETHGNPFCSSASITDGEAIHLNPQLIHALKQHTDVVAECLAQQFVDLHSLYLAPIGCAAE